jgi:hypothetical protein
MYLGDDLHLTQLQVPSYLSLATPEILYGTCQYVQGIALEI